MEPAKIDWTRIDSRFIVDSVYEHINAPKWVDFLSTQDSGDDDDAWFCRPDCNHPKTVEDFLDTTPIAISKLWKSACVKEVSPFKDWNQSDEKGRRGLGKSPISSIIDAKYSEDSENKNLYSTPPNPQANLFKAAIKSGSEKKKLVDHNLVGNDAPPQLKSSLSARNLFGSKDILSHVAEFCNELKKLVTTRAREKENVEKLDEKKNQDDAVVSEAPRKILGEISEVEVEVKVKENEEKSDEKKTPRKILGEISEKYEGIKKGGSKQKLRRNKRADEAENIPFSLNLENVKNKGDERFLQIRTNPPSPQCFSTPTKTTTPSKAPRSKLMDKGILQEGKRNEEAKKDETVDKAGSGSVIYGKQARALDVFWFLNPCTLSE